MLPSRAVTLAVSLTVLSAGACGPGTVESPRLVADRPGAQPSASQSVAPGALARPAPGEIVTVARSRPVEPGTDAREVAFFGIGGLAVDAETGALYVTDQARSSVFRIDTEQRIAPFAGIEVAGFGGDYKPALESPFHLPSALAVAPIGRELLIADTQNRRVRIVPPEGLWVSTLAGRGVDGTPADQLPTVLPMVEATGRSSFSGDGGPALQAEMSLPSGVVMDRRGIVFIADSANHRIRAVNRRPRPTVVAGVAIGGGHIATVAGTGAAGFSGDGGRALAARLNYPTELAVDDDGNVLVVDTHNHRLRRIDRETGLIDTVARGAGAGGLAVDPAAGPAVSIAGVTVDASGSVWYSDRLRGEIVRLRPGEDPEARVVAPPAEVALGSLAAAPDGAIFVADQYYGRVLRVAEGRVETYAGGAVAGERQELGSAAFSNQGPIAVDAAGNLFLGDRFSYSVRRIAAANGTVERFFGSGKIGVSGDGGKPRSARLVHPADILLDADGSVVVADSQGGRVRRVRSTRSGLRVDTLTPRKRDAGPGPGAPLALARHPRTGELYVASPGEWTIYKLTRQGRLERVSLADPPGGAGAEEPHSRWLWPSAMAFDRDGVLYVADMLKHQVRTIHPDGRVEIFAGTGEPGYGGDGGPAREASFSFPGDLVFDAQGNLLISDTHNHRVRRIDAEPPHRIETVVGTGLRGFSGDGGPALEARLNLPRGLAIGADGTLYVVDSLNRRVRAVGLGR